MTTGSIARWGYLPPDLIDPSVRFLKSVHVASTFYVKAYSNFFEHSKITIEVHVSWEHSIWN